MTKEQDQAWTSYLASHGTETGCRSCQHFHENAEVGDYGTVYSIDPECDKHGNYANLPSFPFKKIMPCFVLEFWHTPFPDLFSEEEFADAPLSYVYQQYYAPWLERGASLAELILWEAEHTKEKPS